MGITRESSKFLFFAKKKGVEFSRIITLGRQTLYATPDQISQQLQGFGGPSKTVDKSAFGSGYSEPLFNLLGATTIDSVDVSNYEGATIVHDFNLPIDPALKANYDVVLDAGTIEHIFDVKTALSNCMELLKVGGHFISITPSNNQMGHGFYQFSPELFYTVFSPDNGFEVVAMVIAAFNSKGESDEWFEVANPAVVKDRVQIVNHKPTNLMLIARKTAQLPLFKTMPQQSDYVQTWGAVEEEQVSGKKSSGVKKIYRKIIPSSMRDNIYLWRKKISTKQKSSSSIGKYNPDHFRKMDL